MTAIEIISVAVFIIALAYYAWDCARHAKKTIESNQEREVEVVQDIPIGHTVYDLFPEWKEQIATQLDEDAAFCRLYIIAKDIAEYGLGPKNMTALRKEVDNCKRHFI